MKPLVWTGLGLIVAIGVWISALGIRNVWRAWESTRWPSAPGTVTVSEVKEDDAMYSIRLEAEYTVAGTSYRCTRRHHGQIEGSGDSSEAQLIGFRYPVGKAVRVFYDPASPSNSALKTGFTSDVLWLPGAGLAFLLAGVMFAVLFRSGDTGGGLGFGMAIFALIFCCIGLAMAIPGVHNLWQSYRSVSWPTVPGQIVYGQVDESTSTSEEEDGTETETTTYGTRLVFGYEVNGRTHYSNLRRFNQLAGASEEWAEEIAERYGDPKAVFPVAYDPDDPDTGVLETGITSESFWLPGAGLAFLGFGLAVWFFGIPALTRKV